MRLALNKECSLAELYNASIDCTCFSNYVRTMAMSMNETIARKYCEHNGIQCDSTADFYSHLHSFLRFSYRKILGNFKVDLVSSRFASEAQRSSKKILESFSDSTLYEILGDCNGILILDNTIVSYCLSSKGAVFNLSDRYIGGNVSHYVFENKKNKAFIASVIAKGDDCPLQIQSFIDVIVILIYQKYAQIRTQMIASRVRRNSLDSDEIIANNTPFKINQLDLTWLTNYETDEDISVRGFWRLQACGFKHTQRKLIYVNPYIRHGYHRKAKKLNYIAA